MNKNAHNPTDQELTQQEHLENKSGKNTNPKGRREGYEMRMEIFWNELFRRFNQEVTFDELRALLPESERSITAFAIDKTLADVRRKISLPGYDLIIRKTSALLNKTDAATVDTRLNSRPETK